MLTLYVTKDRFIPIRIDFHDRDKAIFKFMTFVSIRESDDRIIPVRYDMMNIRQGTVTIIHFAEFDRNVTFLKDIFRPEKLEISLHGRSKQVPQFFVASSDITGNVCRIRGDDFRHLATVRRVRIGDRLRLRDESGALLDARVIQVTGDSIEAEIVGARPAASLPAEITLCMSLLKGGNFDTALEKAVEVGVSRIIPVVTGRTVPRPADEAKRVRRWSRKAGEAAKQSLRETVPPVEGIRPFGEVIEDFNDRMRIIAHPGASGSLKEFLRSERADAVSLLVGPEGGFSPEEVSAAQSAGWAALNFGASHLRAETAAPLLCGIIIYEWGD